MLASGSRDGQTESARADAPVFSPGNLICERYRVIRFIARGGMGEVYEVEDLELRTRIALKTIAPERASSARQVERFRQEIQLARKVSHPNVCRVFDLGREKNQVHGDILFLTMELVTGETLAAYLQQHGPMSRDQALPILRQIVSALSAAHHSGIVHRDLKPGNVMLLEGTQGPVVKITDFGLATNPELQETVSGSLPEVLGTPEYMAPEQFRGRCSTRTDIYALGVTVFQMLTGNLPASYEAPFKVAETGSGKRIGQRWREAITKSLAVDPAARYASVEEFWCALSGETLPGQSRWRTLASSIRRHRAIYGAATCLVIAAVALVFAGVIPNPFRPLPREKHLAVLPFQNIGNDAANQAFAEGVVESLTSKLSQLERYQKSFWVVPSSDTRRVKSLDEAHRNLGVTLAITGSVQHTEDGVNLTTNLVDPANHRQLASRIIHVKSANLDEMQQRVWESVADMLDLQVNSRIRQELAAGGTTQSAAYQLYEEGNGYLLRGDVESLDRAISSFNMALTKDPGYALAYAGLGSAYATKYSATQDPHYIAEATRNAGKAVELNDQLVPVRVSLAKVYEQTGQLDKALAEYKRAADEDPADIDAAYHIGLVYQLQGKYQEAEEAYKDVIRRRPQYWPSYSGLGDTYWEQGKFTEALPQFQTVVDLAPDNPVGYYTLGGTYIALGRYQDAIEVLKKGLSIKDDPTAWTNLGAAYMYIGNYEEAAGAMKRAAALTPHDHILWRNLADAYHQIPSRQADAKQAYAKALETALARFKINPKDKEVLSGIALYNAHLGHPSEAETYMNRALELAPNDSDTLFTSTLVYEIIGHREKALVALDRAVKAGYSREDVEKEPELKALRSDPRYQRWLQQAKKKNA